MDDLRSSLERLGDRARPAPDAFERLERTRRRRERNRRLAAAVVAFVVAIGGTLAVVSTFGRGEEPAIGDDDPQAFGAIWPESSFEDALAVQKEAEAGDPSLAWRLSPVDTALAFARDALGWSDPVPGEAVVDGGSARVLIETPPAPCPSPPVPECLPRRAAVELQQPFGPDGIWGVASARSDGFLQAPIAGTEVAPGAELAIPANLEPSTNLYVAWVGLGACAGWEHDVIVTGRDALTLTAPALPEGHPEGCEIALVVLHNDASDHGLEGLGDQLLRYGYRTALYGVLAVSLLLVPEGAEVSVPDVATVKCDGTAVVSDTSVVQAQADGVHFVLETLGGASFSIAEDAGPGGFSDPDTPIGRGDGQGALPSGSVVVEVPPGRYLLFCTATTEGSGSADQDVGTKSIEVVDPAGYYVPSELRCSSEAYGMAPGYAEGATGDPGDPLHVVRSRLTGLEEGDVVELAGYPEGAGEPVIRIVRDGAIVGSVHLFDDGQGGWLLSSLEGCDGTAFGWADVPQAGAAVDCESGNVIELSVVPLEFTLVVEGFDFDIDCVRVPAGERFTINLDNRDPGGSHSVSVYAQGSDEPAFSGDICLGPGTFTYRIPALEAGTYRIVDLHSPQTQDVTLLVE